MGIDAMELQSFIYHSSVSVHADEQTFKLPVYWEGMTLMRHQCNDMIW